VENGDVVADYQYSKETGSLIESKDKEGLLTFYEYAQAPRGLESSPQYAKPVRIYRGTRKLAKLVATLQYDSVGNLIQQTDDKGKTTRFSYDGSGDLIAVVDPAGARTVITCDPFGRRTAIAKGSQQEGAAYDDNGHIKSRQMPDGQLAEFTYDAQGRLQAVKQNGVNVVQYLRDSTGEVIGETDALGRGTRLDRDGFGHVIAVAQPNGSTTRYEYNPAGHRVAQIDGDQNRITFEYDQAGHVVKQTNALGQVLTWAYDAKGHVIQRTNGVQTIIYRYDDAGRLVLLDYGKTGEKLKYAYDAKGRVKKVASPTNSLTFFYDADGGVAAEQFIRGQTSDRVIRYGYDANGRKASVVLSEREMSHIPPKNEPPAYRLIQQTEYAYDPDGHLVEIKSNGATACAYRYDTRGRLASRTYGDGITGIYAYDSFGRQTRFDLAGGPLVTPLSLVYSWDTAGQMTSRQWNGETQVYGYDASGQLLTVATPGSNASPASQAATGGLASDYQQASNPPSATANILESYHYDAAGNMLDKYEEGVRTVMTYDAGNQLKTATVRGVQTNFTYDQAGRLLSETGPNAKTREYGFLDKVLVLTKPGGVRIGYDYYPDGQLAAKGPLQSGASADVDTDGRPRSSLFNQLSTLKETDPDLEQSESQKAMGITEEFLWDGLALLYRDGETYAIEPHASGGVSIASTRDPQSEEKTYFINDILGTTLAVVRPDRIEIVPLTTFGKPRGTNSLSAPRAQAPKLSTEKGSP
jgi:YD repeat-containing protein